MKSSDFTLVLQQQLDVANETNRVLLARIDDLGKTIEELRTELAIANLKREELMSTITSMQEALLEKDADVNKQKTAYEIKFGDWSSDVCSSDLQLSLAL